MISFFLSFSHFFLAKHDPIQADLLIVEGWLPDYVLKKSIREFQDENYRLILTTGGHLFRGYHLSYYNLITLGAHSGRSFTLFQKVFFSVPGLQLGFIPIPPREYETGIWWSSSAGVRSVLYEGIAYFYALLF